MRQPNWKNSVWVARFALLVSIAALVFVIANKCHAFDLSVTGNQTLLESKNLDPSRGVLLEAGNLWRVSLSFEDTLLRFGGQEACDVRLYGLAIVRQVQIGAVTFALGGGYYMPEIERRKGFREAMWLEINHAYPEGAHRSFNNRDKYDYELHGNFGGFFRVSFEQYMTKHLSVYFAGGYRYLKLQENLVRDHRAYSPGSWVEFMRWQDLSGCAISLGLIMKF